MGREIDLQMKRGFEHVNGGSFIFYQFAYLISTGIHRNINLSNCSNGVWGKERKAEA